MAKFLRWPFDGPRVVTRGFLYKDPLYIGGVHMANDIVKGDGPSEGAELKAVTRGTLYLNPLYDYYNGWNGYIITPDGWRVGYRHMRELHYPPNTPIPLEQGDLVGYADSTGVVIGAHLHIDWWHLQKKSDEAMFKVGYWAHDFQRWFYNFNPDVEDDDMANVVITEGTFFYLVKDGQQQFIGKRDKNNPVVVTDKGGDYGRFLVKIGAAKGIVTVDGDELKAMSRLPDLFPPE